MPYTSLLGQYLEERLYADAHRPYSSEACDRLYDMCAAGIAAEERFPGSTGANSRWWASELLCWLNWWADDARAPITPRGVR